MYESRIKPGVWVRWPTVLTPEQAVEQTDLELLLREGLNDPNTLALVAKAGGVVVRRPIGFTIRKAADIQAQAVRQ